MNTPLPFHCPHSYDECRNSQECNYPWRCDALDVARIQSSAAQAPAEFHDFRDTGSPLEKRSVGSWNDFANRPDWNLDAYGRQARAGR